MKEKLQVKISAVHGCKTYTFIAFQIEIQMYGWMDDLNFTSFLAVNMYYTHIRR